MLELAQDRDVLGDRADPLAQRVVVGVRRLQQLDAVGAQGAHGRDDVVGRDRDVLHAGTAVEVQVLLDLRLLAARGRLVDRQLHLAGRVLHHFGAQRGELGRDVLVVEADQLLEAEGARVVVAPGLHLAPADVGHAVVDPDAGRPGSRARSPRRPGHEAGQPGAAVAGRARSASAPCRRRRRSRPAPRGRARRRSRRARSGRARRRRRRARRPRARRSSAARRRARRRRGGGRARRSASSPRRVERQHQQ